MIRPFSYRHAVPGTLISMLGLAIAVRAGATVFIVTTTADSGDGSLRQAILDANALGGADQVHFNIPNPGVHTISPLSPLPSVTGALDIDATTQPGYAGVPLIELDGTNAGASADGITIAANNSAVRGFVINRFGGNGILLTAGNAVIVGNYIGVNSAGTAISANGGDGLNASGGGNTIGGTAAAARNVISGNVDGITLAGGNNVVEGNYIGTDVAGTASIGNTADGIVLSGGANNVIGGTAAGAGNVVSGNGHAGINLTGGSGATIEGNLIGLDASGTVAMPNGSFGVLISGAAANNNAIGDVAAGAGNTIAFHVTNVAALHGTGNSIRGNSIYSGSALGIDLNDDGVTANDHCDADVGPNNLQNFPVLTSVDSSGGSTHIVGTLDSIAKKDFQIDFYSTPTCNPSGNGEGKTFLGSAIATADLTCHAPIDVTLPVAVSSGDVVTATATDAAGNTSEFSPCLSLSGSLTPAALQADPSGNNVFEAGEAVMIRPSWTNSSGGPQNVTATASGFTGPSGPVYAIVDSQASYGTLGAHSTGSCNADCYTMIVTATARPVQHWDATFTETPSAGGAPKDWTLHVGDSFTDVPRTESFYSKIETVFHFGITSGCTATEYCPRDSVSRSAMAIFIAKAIAGSGAAVPVSGTVGGNPYNCVSGGTSLFSDVAPTAIYCKHIHYIAAQNVTLGCSASRYCPDDVVTRLQMASFIAKGTLAPGGGAAVPVTYGPDPVTGFSYSCNAGSPNLHFADVPAADAFCKHVHFLWAKGIIAGCSASTYCPGDSVTRDQMAKFLTNAFRLTLYGP